MTTEPTSDESPAVCWCCGEERSEPELARLNRHSEVALCDVCLGWLWRQAGAPTRQPAATPSPSCHTRCCPCPGALRRPWVRTEAWVVAATGSPVVTASSCISARSRPRPRNVVSCYLFVGDADALHWSGLRPAPAASSRPPAIPTMAAEVATSTPTATSFATAHPSRTPTRHQKARVPADRAGYRIRAVRRAAVRLAGGGWTRRARQATNPSGRTRTAPVLEMP